MGKQALSYERSLCSPHMCNKQVRNKFRTHVQLRSTFGSRSYYTGPRFGFAALISLSSASIKMAAVLMDIKADWTEDVINQEVAKLSPDVLYTFQENGVSKEIQAK